jgi:hypothetical protein
MLEQESAFKEESVTVNQMAGFGDEIVKFIKKDTQEIICFIGKQDSKDMIFFQKPIDCQDMISIAELIGKKKMKKALAKGNFEKAQKIASKS